MVPDPSSLTLFVTGSIILLVIPGPAVFYVLSRAVGQGRSAGLVSAAGISVGTLCHATAAVLGLSALLASSARAFQTVKFAGAAYLVFLGVRTLLGKAAEQGPASGDVQSLFSVFGQGILVNVLNPKSALFFLAFLPQFVNPSKGHVTSQILFLGVLFAVMGLISDSSWALVAGNFAAKLRSSLRWRRAQKNISGGALIALGLATAFFGAKAK
jgi:threonine/homoserine/homoserine lactone efflux protein